MTSPRVRRCPNRRIEEKKGRRTGEKDKGQQAKVLRKKKKTTGGRGTHELREPLGLSRGAEGRRGIVQKEIPGERGAKILASASLRWAQKGREGREVKPSRPVTRNWGD